MTYENVCTAVFNFFYVPGTTCFFFQFFFQMDQCFQWCYCESQLYKETCFDNVHSLCLCFKLLMFKLLMKKSFLTNKHIFTFLTILFGPLLLLVRLYLSVWTPLSSRFLESGDEARLQRVQYIDQGMKHGRNNRELRLRHKTQPNDKLMERLPVQKLQIL